VGTETKATASDYDSTNQGGVNSYIVIHIKIVCGQQPKGE